MSKIIIICLKFIFSLLPLILIQLLGILVGHIFHIFNKKSRELLISNLTNSKIYKSNKDLKKAINKNIGETGKTILEGFAIWVSKEKRILSWVKEVEGLEEIQKAHKNNKGIIFLTPHLGCYEITSIYYGSKFPLTILYRPPRQKWLTHLIKKGRQKGMNRLAPTDKSGIKLILKALINSEAVGILPDQAANKGEGEWVNFFGRPAYTMILVSKLAKKTGANIIIAFGERLDLGKGFKIHLKSLPSNYILTPKNMNKVLEEEIRKAPDQYLWNYDKHKGYKKNKSIKII